MIEKKLRVILLSGGTTFEAWEAAAIREVLSLPFVDLVLRIEEIPHTDGAKPAYLENRHALWRLHNRRHLQKIKAYQRIDLSSELGNVPVLRCKTEKKGKYSEHFSPGDLNTIRTYQPDIILRFAFNILRGEILTAATYGVWSFHHADVQKIRGGPGAFWEIYQGDVCTGALLQRLTEKLDGGIPLKTGWFPTIAHSYAANLDQLLMGTASWMKQVCIAIRNADTTAPSASPVQTTAPLYTFPTNAQMLRFKWKLFGRKFRFHWRELFRAEQWNIGIVDQPLETVAFGSTLQNVNWLAADAANRYKADPFGVVIEGKEFLLYERYEYSREKGHLETVSDQREHNTLDLSAHLSYPYIIQHSGKTYVVPESYQANEAALYQLDPETIKLQRITKLIDGPAVDSSLIFFENRWWLFCTMEDRGSNHNLFIYFADQLEGPYQPHALNPVKTDIGSARPAGVLFIKNNTLYRPAQDCSTTYGSAVVIQEIVQLTPFTFEEKTVNRLAPKPSWKYDKGLHTISRLGEKTLIDAKRDVFTFTQFFRSLKRKLRLG